VAHLVFYVVTEKILEKQHVTGQMHPTAVQENMSVERWPAIAVPRGDAGRGLSAQSKKKMLKRARSSLTTARQTGGKRQYHRYQAG